MYLFEFPLPGLLSCEGNREIIIYVYIFPNIFLTLIQVDSSRSALSSKKCWYLLAWSVGFMNFPLLVEEVERRPIVSVRLFYSEMIEVVKYKLL